MKINNNILLSLTIINSTLFILTLVLLLNLQNKFNNLYEELEKPVLSVIREREIANQPRNIGENMDAVFTGNEVVLGNNKANVTIIKYNSFSCGYCQLASEVVDEIHKKYGDKVKIIYKHFNRTNIDNLTSQAVECAGEQNKFWELYWGFFETNITSLDDIKKVAKKHKLKTKALLQCIDSKKYLEKTNKETETGSSIGVRGTPAFLINGTLYSGYRPFDFFDKKIQELL